ncbi:MAG TPA: ABC-2 family transporter protein, partial [Chthoniobacteraceae bacterium]|nr:ABC-2 family transporter protein [Chthoniobacteraceae bacterium]
MSALLRPRLALFWKFFDIGLQNTFVYRWNFLLRSIFGIVPLVGTVYLWQAVYATRGGEIKGYDYSEMIFYFLLTVFVEQLITPTEDEWQIAAEIRDGKISAYLTKPLNYLGYRIALFVSYRLLYVSVVLVPIL